MREYIKSLSEQWQNKINLRFSSGLCPFFNDEDKKETEDDLARLTPDFPLETEFKWTSDDSDLPDKADCGLIESGAA